MNSQKVSILILLSLILVLLPTFAFAQARPTIDILDGNGQIQVVAQPIANPLRVIVKDENGKPVQEEIATFKVESGGGYFRLDANLNPIIEWRVKTDVNGIASTTFVTVDAVPPDPNPANPSNFYVGKVAGSLEAGPMPPFDPANPLYTGFCNNEISATISTDLGPRWVTFRLATVADAPAKIEKVSGDNQSGLMLTILPENLTVVIRDQYGNPYVSDDRIPINAAHPVVLAPRAIVRFTTANANTPPDSPAGSTIPALLPDAQQKDVATDDYGRTSAVLRLGDLAPDSRKGDYKTNVGIPAIPAVAPVVFTATAVEPWRLPTNLAIVSGDGQIGAPGEPLLAPFVVKVTDKDGQPVEGWEVNFKVIRGTGTLPGEVKVIKDTTTTDGTARVVLTLGRDPDLNLKGKGLFGDEWHNAVDAVISRYDDNGNFVGDVAVHFVAMAAPPTDISVAGGNYQTGVVDKNLANPLTVLIQDTNGNPLERVKVLFEVMKTDKAEGDGTLSTIGGDVTGSRKLEVKTDATGLAKVNLKLGKTAGVSNNVVHATALLWNTIDEAWEQITVVFTATAKPDVPASIEIASGNNQEEIVASILPDHLTVIVRDKFGNKVLAGDEKVTFSLDAWSLGAGAKLLDPADQLTDDKGKAAIGVQLGTVSSLQALAGTHYKVTALAVAANKSVTFDLWARPGPGATIKIAGGDLQEALINTTLANALQVLITDKYGNKVPNWPVTFIVEAGGGKLLDPTYIGKLPPLKDKLCKDVTTGATATDIGIASVKFTLGPYPGVDAKTGKGLNKVNAMIYTGQANTPLLLDDDVEDVNDTMFTAIGLVTTRLEIVVNDPGHPGGDNQQGAVNNVNGWEAILKTSLRVRVWDTSITPERLLNGIPVTFEVESGPGSLRKAMRTPEPGEPDFIKKLDPIMTKKIATDGEAEVWLVIKDGDPGVSPDVVKVNATIKTYPADNPVKVTFTAFAVTGKPGVYEPTAGKNAIFKFSGDLQTQIVNRELSKSIIADVHDRWGNSMIGVPVDFEVTKNGGKLATTTGAPEAARKERLIGTVDGVKTDRRGLAEVYHWVGKHALVEPDDPANRVPNNEIETRVVGAVYDPATEHEKYGQSFSDIFKAFGVHDVPVKILVLDAEKLPTGEYDAGVGTVATPLASGVEVKVVDQFDNPVFYKNALDPGTTYDKHLKIHVVVMEPNPNPDYRGAFEVVGTEAWKVLTASDAFRNLPPWFPIPRPGALLKPATDNDNPLSWVNNPNGDPYRKGWLTPLNTGMTTIAWRLGVRAWTNPAWQGPEIETPGGIMRKATDKLVIDLGPEFPNVTSQSVVAVANPGEPKEVLITERPQKLAADGESTGLVKLVVNDEAKILKSNPKVSGNTVTDPTFPLHVSAKNPVPDQLVEMSIPPAVSGKKGLFDARFRQDLLPEEVGSIQSNADNLGNGYYQSPYKAGNFLDDRTIADEITIKAKVRYPGGTEPEDRTTIILTNVKMDVVINPIVLMADGNLSGKNKAKIEITLMDTVETWDNPATGMPEPVWRNNETVLVELIQPSLGTVTPSTAIPMGQGKYEASYNPPTVPGTDVVAITVVSHAQNPATGAQVWTRNLTIPWTKNLALADQSYNGPDPFSTYNGLAPKGTDIAYTTNVGIFPVALPTIGGAITLTATGEVSLEAKADKPELPADGNSTAQITIFVRDKDENPVRNVDTKLEIVQGSGSITAGATGKSDKDGARTATYNAGLVAGTVILRATVTTSTLLIDNDKDGKIDEDPIDSIDNDNDGKIDEDPPITADVYIVLTVDDQVPPKVLVLNDVPGSTESGKDYLVKAEVTDAAGIGAKPSGVKSVTLKYRVGGKTLWNNLPMTLDSGTNIQGEWRATIPAGDVAIYGLAYYIEAVDNSGNLNLDNLEDNPYTSEEPASVIVYGGSLKASRISREPGVKYLTPPLGDTTLFKADEWYTVALPGDLVDPTPADSLTVVDVFDKSAGWGTENNNWRALLFDPTVPKGTNPWTTALFMEQGRGAFVMPFDVDKELTLSGKSRDITKPYVIPLKPGWNIVGNPFSFGRFWDDATICVQKGDMVMPITQASLADLVHDVIYWYNPEGPDDDIGGTAYDAVSSDPNMPNQAWEVDDDPATVFPAALGPYSGFWVLAWEECELLVDPTALGPEDVAPAPSPAIITGEPLVKMRSGLKPPELPAFERMSEPKVESTALLQNYPNPFNPETWLPYQLSKEADVTIYVYDLKGSLVRILTLGQKPSGFYLTKEKAAYWDGRNDLGERVASGIYFYQLHTKSFTSQPKKMLIIK